MVNENLKSKLNFIYINKIITGNLTFLFLCIYLVTLSKLIVIFIENRKSLFLNLNIFLKCRVPWGFFEKVPFKGWNTKFFQQAINNFLYTFCIMGQ